MSDPQTEIISSSPIIIVCSCLDEGLVSLWLLSYRRAQSKAHHSETTLLYTYVATFLSLATPDFALQSRNIMSLLYQAAVWREREREGTK